MYFEFSIEGKKAKVDFNKLKNCYELVITSDKKEMAVIFMTAEQGLEVSDAIFHEVNKREVAV